MIIGEVNARREAVVRLRVRRQPGGPEQEIHFILDTGFTGALTLSPVTVGTLGLIRQSGGRAAMADGSIRSFDLYAAEIMWEGTWLPALVSAVGDEPLLGMRLLADHSLQIEIVPGGHVRIAPLP